MTEQPTTSLSWTKVAGGAYRCARHGETFKMPATCSQCTPGANEDADTAEPVVLPKPPAGCMSSVQRERWFSKVARDALKDAERLKASADPKPVAEVVFKAPDVKAEPAPASEVNFHVEANRVKYLDVAIKAARAATALTLAREDEQIVIARERRLRKGRSH